MFQICKILAKWLQWLMDKLSGLLFCFLRNLYREKGELAVFGLDEAVMGTVSIPLVWGFFAAGAFVLSALWHRISAFERTLEWLWAPGTLWALYRWLRVRCVFYDRSGLTICGLGRHQQKNWRSLRAVELGTRGRKLVFADETISLYGLGGDGFAAFAQAKQRLAPQARMTVGAAPLKRSIKAGQPGAKASRCPVCGRKGSGEFCEVCGMRMTL